MVVYDLLSCSQLLVQQESPKKFTCQCCTVVDERWLDPCSVTKVFKLFSCGALQENGMTTVLLFPHLGDSTSTMNGVHDQSSLQLITHQEGGRLSIILSWDHFTFEVDVREVGHDINRLKISLVPINCEY